MEQNAYDTSLVSTMPQELILIAMSFTDIESNLAFSETCKALHKCYKDYSEKKTALVLYDPQDKRSLYSDYIEELYPYMSRNGCLRIKFTPISDYQNGNYPVKVLCSTQALNLPKGLDFKSIDALIMIFSNFELRRFIIDDSFFEKFPNLRALILRNAYFYKKLVFKLPLLELISLYGFEENNVLKQATPAHSHKLQVDVSDSTQLKYLTLGDPDYFTNIKLPLLERLCLRKLELHGPLEDTQCFGTSLASVEKLVLRRNLIRWKNIVGTASDLSKSTRFDPNFNRKFISVHFLKFKSLKMLYIIDPDPEYSLDCMFSLGTTSIMIKLIWPSSSDQPKKVQKLKFELDPRAVKYVPIPFIEPTDTKYLNQ